MKPRKTKVKQQQPAAPTTWSELARQLGVSRQLLSARRKQLGADAPAVGDVAAWKSIMAAFGYTGSLPPDLREELGREKVLLTRALRRKAEAEASRVDDRRDLVPRAEMERAVTRLAVGLQWAHAGFENCSQLVAGINEPMGVWFILKKVVHEFMPTACASLRILHPPLPAWLVETFSNATEQFPGDTEHSKELAECIRGFIGAHAIRARELYDERVAAEAAYGAEQDPVAKAKIYHERLAPLMPGRMPAQQPAPAPTPAAP